ncbi:MAG: hypothetical protein M3680_24705, partial [Myxococcota bacterium]|nr:hypothetical protein [Myxococcota bacterium]
DPTDARTHSSRELHARCCNANEGRVVITPTATEIQQSTGHRPALHPKKTRRFSFRPPRDGDDKGGSTFDFLGFTSYWRRTKRGMQRMAFRTRGVRLRRAINAATDWCRRHRHEPVEEQHLALTRKLNGHYNYFGVNGNSDALNQLRYWITRAWRKWLDRRSQRARMNWTRFRELLRRFPLPAPRIRVQIWGKP